ncbi:gamma subclass chorismate mutase AroQ [Pseudomonas sp. JR33AA]|uniref:gamma subclass chorismate mutase AroQ n=1 Tax=Pseudomonas sp. JR33AA TaxID=2899113 RepID=UPI001F487C88|nr:gamma subclass chorismate mutase AroQ [Pseudomonas sp. JR33AA]MCE5975595.1 gamma subclass chorismate mutase AroQ [Pseudomonas sp. JR33AA]
MRPAITLLCLPFALIGCTAPEASHPEFNPLLSNIEYRLNLASSVALHKWEHNLAVAAPDREREVLALVRQQAADHDLSPERATAFFSDQIEANKLMQYTLLDRWITLRQRPSTTVLDLVDQLRPRLDKLQTTLLFELGRFDQQPPEDCARKLANALHARTNDPIRHLALVRATAQLCPKH